MTMSEYGFVRASQAGVAIGIVAAIMFLIGFLFGLALVLQVMTTPASAAETRIIAWSHVASAKEPYFLWKPRPVPVVTKPVPIPVPISIQSGPAATQDGKIPGPIKVMRPVTVKPVPAGKLRSRPRIYKQKQAAAKPATKYDCDRVRWYAEHFSEAALRNLAKINGVSEAEGRAIARACGV